MIRKRFFKRFVRICILTMIFSLSGSQFSLAFEKEIKDLSLIMAKDIVEAGRKTIAVVDFTDLQGNVTELGRFIAEELSVALAGSANKFEVIDRIHLLTILQEHKLAMGGLIDPSTARKLGKIAGVDALVTGTITPFGESVRLSAKILDTETAKIIGASTAEIPKTKAIEDLLEKGIYTVGEQTTNPIPSKPRPKTKQRVESRKFTFELIKCELAGGVITCSFLITNNDQDRILELPRGSRMFDNSGNEYYAERIQLANKEEIVRGSRSILESLLVSGIPTRAKLTFEKVSPEARSIALLELRCVEINSSRNEGFKVQFRNIPLSK